MARVLIGCCGESPVAEGHHSRDLILLHHTRRDFLEIVELLKKTLGATVWGIHRYKVNMVWETGEADNGSTFNVVNLRVNKGDEQKKKIYGLQSHRMTV